MMQVIVPGNPVGKPRMTRRDKWQKRPCVLRYRTCMDALFENDQFVYAGAFEKYWEDERGPRVEILIE